MVVRETFSSAFTVGLLHNLKLIQNRIVTKDSLANEACHVEIDLLKERGEFHTCVLSGPIFHTPINVTLGAHVFREERFQYCDLIDVAESVGTRGAMA